MNVGSCGGNFLVSTIYVLFHFNCKLYQYRAVQRKSTYRSLRNHDEVYVLPNLIMLRIFNHKELKDLLSGDIFEK